jgi:putative hydrolase of the HAD superfamily
MYDTLIRLIQDLTVPMDPLPPPALPPALEALLYPENRKEALSGVRAVLFDIYGTLFTSAAGKIGLEDAGDKAAVLGEAASGEAASGEAAAGLTRELGGAYTAAMLKEYFRSAVRQIHRELAEKTAYPEIRVEDVWAEFIRREAGRIPLGIGPEELALRYELAMNPVFPMPGARGALQALKASGLTLGIISNAQFFTPLIFAAFFDALPDNLGFDPGLVLYSYEWGEAKPSPALFARAREGLAVRGIPPEACLYVGNDMLNDIHAAAAVGFRTLLFAGDGRSLRLREDHPELRQTLPTAVLRRLAELPGLCGRTEPQTR